MYFLYQLYRILYGICNLVIICIIILFHKLINNYNRVENNTQTTYKSISFSGGGWKAFYHVGVFNGLKEIAPEYMKDITYIGTSMGAFIAVMCCCDIDFYDKVIPLTIKMANKYRTNFFNNLTHMGQNIRTICDECLPLNAHKIVSGRCYIVITKITWSGINKKIINKFKSRTDLIDAIVASMYIPLWTDINLLQYRNNICLDGCITDYCYKLNENTITVTFDKSGNIYPSTNNYYSTFYPPSKQFIYKLISIGKKDSIYFYKKYKL